MGFESFDTKTEVPAELLAYEAWWKKTYGEAPNSETDTELMTIAKKLATTDAVFAEMLKDSLFKEFVDNDEGLNDAKKRRWAMLGALSTYGKKFGLKVD